MRHKLGLHWIRVHPDQYDFDHIAKMQYRSAKVFGGFWDNRDACANLVAAMPQDAYFLARDHPLSEEKQGIWDDPLAHGRRHAQEWIEKVKQGRVHLPLDRTFFLGVNEPDATHGDRDKIDIYNASFLDTLGGFGFRGGAFNFSTGHPRTLDGTGATKADYALFVRSHEAIRRGSHIAVAHIYGTGAVPLAPGHYDRLTSCPWTDVEWIIGECGIDEHVIGGGPHIGFHGYYANNLDEYTDWIDDFIYGIERIFPYIHSYMPFTYDFSHPWGSFNVQAIRPALERMTWAHSVPRETLGKPPDVFLPSTPNNNLIIPAVGQVITTVHANLRTAPTSSSQVIKLLEPGFILDLVGYNNRWHKVLYENSQGEFAWIHDSVVQPYEGGEPVPLPGGVVLVRPCEGWVTQRWGENPQNYAQFGIPGHNGLDIAAPIGTPVRAIADGNIVFAGTDNDYGRYTRIDHPQLGIQSFYAHMDVNPVTGRIEQGQHLGTVGNTGNSTGPHLHLEIRLASGQNYIPLSGGHGKGRIDPEIAYWLFNKEPFK